MADDGGEAEWIRRVAARDREASAALFDRYAPELHGFVVRQAGASDADDLLQEVFVRALRGASGYRGDASVRTWLYAIARYVVLERRRERLFEGLSGLVAAGPGPESFAARAEEREELLAALEQLPDDQAIVLALHRVDGLSHDEIAERLRIRPAASRKRLERALAAVRRLLRRPTARRARHRHLDSWQRSLAQRLHRAKEEDPRDVPGRSATGGHP